MSCGNIPDMEKEKRILLDTDRKFAQTSKDLGPAEAFRLYLFEDALQLPNGHSPISGLQNIYESMKAGSSNDELHWQPVDGAVAQSLDFGYTWGNYVSIAADETGQKIKNYGKYLNIWKKNKAGSWKVLVDMGNSNPIPKKIN